MSVDVIELQRRIASERLQDRFDEARKEVRRDTDSACIAIISRQAELNTTMLILGVGH